MEENSARAAVSCPCNPHRGPQRLGGLRGGRKGGEGSAGSRPARVCRWATVGVTTHSATRVGAGGHTAPGRHRGQKKKWGDPRAAAGPAGRASLDSQAGSAPQTHRDATGATPPHPLAPAGARGVWGCVPGDRVATGAPAAAIAARALGAAAASLPRGVLWRPPGRFRGFGAALAAHRSWFGSNLCIYRRGQPPTRSCPPELLPLRKGLA